MITEKGRPAKNGPIHKLPGHEFTGSLLAPSTDSLPCVSCNFDTTERHGGQAYHRQCWDAASLAGVPSGPSLPAAKDTTGDAEVLRAQDIARDLIRAGVPVFAAPPDAGSSVGFRLPHRWQDSTPNLAEVDKWQPGWALCAVAGHAVDVLDTDPRNGGDVSAAALREAGMWPNTYGRAETPSGGTHDLIAPLRVGKGVPAEGVDLQGGKDDGTGRGFVFIAPTVRVSKVDGIARPYRWVQEPDLDRLAQESASDDSGQHVTALLAQKRAKTTAPEVPASTRPDIDDLFSGPAPFPKNQRLFTDREAADFCRPAMEALRSAPHGEMNNRLNDAAVRLSHFNGVFWSEQDAHRALLAALPAAYDHMASANETIRSGFKGGRDPWKAQRRPEGAGQPGQVPGQPDPQRVNTLRERMRARLHTRDTLDTIEPPTPLIDGVLDKGTIALLSGKFGTYKTFVSLSWACSVATGTAWEGLEVVTPGPVLYVAAEGCSGLRSRVRAWEIGQYGGDRIPADRLAVFNGRVKLTDPDETTVLGEFITDLRPVLVVVDTLHQCAPGMDENSSKDMGTVLGAVAELRERYGVTVLLNHHTGHNGERARGSSALEDDVDTSWVINLADAESRAAENQRTLKHRKAKDRELLQDRPILLRTVPESGSAYVEGGTVTPNALLPDGLVALKVIEWLDELDVPVSAGRPACAAALKGAGRQVPRNEVLADAIKRRKAAAWVGQE